MMSLPDVIEAILPGVIAFGSRMGSGPAPKIIGSGFVVDARGIVATAGHVARSLYELPRDPQTNRPTAFAMTYGPPETISPTRQEAVAAIVGISRIALLADFETGREYYGELVPDIAFVQLHVRDVPTLNVDETPGVLRPGEDVAYCGYPLGAGGLAPTAEDGSRTLLQSMPFVRRGIISSVHPFPGPSPDGFTIDAMSQGGASGAPIFLATRPAVVGMLVSAVEGTNLTFALPGWLIRETLQQCIEKRVLGAAPSETLKQWLARNAHRVKRHT